MKKILTTVLLILFSASAVADEDSATIRINLSGNLKDNRYFLCSSDIGCLSIRNAQRGKVFPILRSFQLENMYVTDLATRRLYRQSLPSSCTGEVSLNKTITISGDLNGKNGQINIIGLHCSIH